MTETQLVDLKPLLDVGLQILAAVLLALGSWAATWLVKKLKLSADSEVRLYLDQALQRGVTYAVEHARTRGADLARVEVRNEIVAKAASYAATRVPDALKHFNVTPEQVKAMVIARLPASGNATEVK